LAVFLHSLFLCPLFNQKWLQTAGLATLNFRRLVPGSTAPLLSVYSTPEQAYLGWNIDCIDNATYFSTDCTVNIQPYKSKLHHVCFLFSFCFRLHSVYVLIFWLPSLCFHGLPSDLSNRTCTQAHWLSHVPQSTNRMGQMADAAKLVC